MNATIPVFLKRAAAPLCILLGAYAPHALSADLTVTVDGVLAANGGTVLYELDSSAAGWDNKDKPYATAGVKVAANSVTYTFKDVAPGTYAIGVFQDENDNGKLDTNFLGIPKEGYGFSNNPHLMRKPTFDEAHFELTAEGATIVIHLIHGI